MDQQPKQEIPRVKPEVVIALHNTVEYVLSQPEGTTSTFCHAYLPGKDGKRFYLTTGISACVHPDLFNAALGIEMAQTKAISQAKDMLWQLEGYHLFKELDK